ncbi:MAG TPA: TolC family protein, partial [Pirellulales bacterium]|nr:TolC family protein [Pirellulales bacterium]
TLANPNVKEYWDLTLEEAMRTALANAKVLRNLGGLLFTPGLPASNQTIAPTGQLLQTQGQNPSGTSLGVGQTQQTIYHPAIQETNPQSGVEAALSQFDAQFNSQMFWQSNDHPQPTFFNGLTAPIFIQDFAQQQAEIGKVSAVGSRYFLRQHVFYDQNNNTANQFPSSVQTDIEAEIRHPLLQGAGIDFNRIAGPNSQAGIFAGQGTNGPIQNPNSVTGNYNGVLLARINVDLTLADFEAGVRNFCGDLERAYWDLYYNYRNLSAVQAGRDSALATWRKVYALYTEGVKGGEAEKEAQAREQYFLFRAQVENSLGLLYTAESRVRYMMGLAPTDGRLIRPADEPTTAEVRFDWKEILPEALNRSVELRRQRWVIKQNELKLIASRNFLLPRLDLQGLYRWRGFGDQLANYNGQAYNPNVTTQAQGFALNRGSGSLNTLFGGAFQEWQMGINLTVPVGFRLAMSGVRNAELVLAASRALMQDQELELAHQMTNSIRDLDRNYQVSVTTFNRRVAAARQVEAVNAAYQVGTATLDMLLDAQRRLADAEIAYYRALVDYNVAILQVHYRKNSLLEYNGIQLAEGPWPAKAYFDARKRARERDAALFINYGFTKPKVSSRGIFPQQMNQKGQVFEGSQLPSDEGKETVPTPDNAVPETPATRPGDLPMPSDQRPSIDENGSRTGQPQSFGGPRLGSDSSDEQAFGDDAPALDAAAGGRGWTRDTRSARASIVRVGHDNEQQALP